MGFPISHAESAAIEARINGQEELIVAAAVRWGKLIVMVERPGRHGDCLNAIGHLGSGKDQGFVTNKGRFVGRQEAAKMVLESGQASPRVFEGYPLTMFSEDLWNGPEGSQHPDDPTPPTKPNPLGGE